MAENIITVSPTMSIDEIQECLKQSGKTIKFSKGTYNITKILTIYSDTTLILTGAILVRKNPSHIFRGYVNPNISYTYNAVKNVTIKGGTFVGDGLKQSGSIMGFIHADNILIENVTFKRTYYSHTIDLPACKNVTIHKCKFSGRIIDPEGSFREEIQYDVAFLCGYPYYDENAKVYNGNHCENLLIDGCTFSGSNFCIGTHTESASSKKHKNIKIINCTAKGNVIKYAGCFAKIINTDGFIVKDNDISGFTKGIVVTSCGRFYNSDGSIVSSKPSVKTGSCNGTIEGNKIYNAKGKDVSAGIQFRSEFDDLLHSNITIKDNKFDLNNIKAKNDIDVSKVNDVNIIGNTTKLNIKVDSNTTNNVVVK